MNEQSHYKQDKTKTRQIINVKSHIFNVRGDNDKTKQTPTRMLSMVQRSLKKETLTLGEIVSLNYIKSNKNVIGSKPKLCQARLKLQAHTPTRKAWEFGKLTSRDSESLESYYSRFYKMMNELIRNQCHVTNHQVNVQFLLQLQPEWQRSQQSTRNRGKAIVTSSAPTYDPEPATVTEDEEMSKEKEIDKLMALISLSFKKIYKPTNNNLRTSLNTSRANQYNSLRINRGTRYDNQRAVNVAGARENVGTLVVQKSGIQCYNCKEYGHVSRECQKPKRDDTDDESDDQELEAYYMYIAQLQEVTPDLVDSSGPIFDDEPMHKVQNNNDNYNVFAMENEHPEQPESSNDIYFVDPTP
ncbi:integrase, catalytic region, zinc finger, CCHC-type containing protein [Tanacetum coccineum]